MLECGLTSPHARSYDSPPPPLQVNTISRSQLIDLAQSYPMAKAALKKAALYMLVRAGILAYYRRHVRSNEPLPGNNIKVRNRVRMQGLCEVITTVDDPHLDETMLNS